MPNDHLQERKIFNGPIEFSGSASGVVGDVYEHGTRYNIQHHHHNYYAPLHAPPRALLTDYAHGQHVHNTGKGLALLSFDGSPFGGLGSLLVLKGLMERVAHIQGLPHPAKPCEFFDMISGTGVGGLLAILLGCLELTIDQCISEYLRFSEFVLCKQTHFRNDTTDLHVVDPIAVERFVKQILRNLRQSEDRLLQAQSALSCKVFVKVADLHAEQTRILRSYQIQSPDDHSLRYIRLWQAVQATLATSSLFHPVTIEYGNHSVIYAASTSLQNSSLQDIFAEAQTHLLDGNQDLIDHLDSLVSVGSMICGNATQNDLAESSPSLLSDVCTANQAACRKFSESCASLTPSGQFCRIEVPLGPAPDNSWFSEDRTQLAVKVEDYINSRSTADRLKPCFARLSRHQLAPGFAIMQEPQCQVELSDQSSMLPQPEQISSYNARLSHYRRSQPRVKDTCTWIFKNPTFIKWCQTLHTSALVCTGTVGCGKSFLAAAVIDHMQELRLNAHSSCFHYFFETGTKSPLALDELYRAMIKQLMGFHNNTMLPFPPKISTALRVFGSTGLSPSTEELASLLKMLVDYTPPSVYLIDGIDELGETQLLDMFDMLRCTFADHNPHGSKLALFSRENLGRGISIEPQLTRISQIHSIRLGVANLSKDIARFVEVQVNEQQLRRIITANEDLIGDVKKKLISHSEKMFLWIHLQIQTIWDPCMSKNDEDIRALINNLPNGLDKTYEMCLRRIENHDDQKHREIAVKAFRWISAAKTPLTPRQAREVVSMDHSYVQLPESKILNASVTEYCGNLLTTDITNRWVQFTHASVKQFLGSPSKIPHDLSRYYLEPEHIARECVSLCLTYLNTFISQRQLMVQQRGATITYNVPRVIESGLSTSSKLAGMARFFISKSSRTRFGTGHPAPSWTTPNIENAQLKMHDYFVRNWLAHTSEITASDPNFSIFRHLCSHGDSELFPWLCGKGTEVSVFQQLAQYSVVGRHLPLLRTIRDHLKKHAPGLLPTVFESHCPGTNVRLVHMAAALGLTDVLQELSTFCNLNVFDGERDLRTPVAWAAEKSHFDTVKWLLKRGGTPFPHCRRKQEVDMSLPAVLAGLDTDTSFWKVYNPSDSFWHSVVAYRKELSQAIFAACTKGHISLAQQLMSFNPEAVGSPYFQWPGWGTCMDKSLMHFALTCGNVQALKSLVIIQGNEEDITGAVKRILAWIPAQILPVCEFLCLPEVLPALIRSQIWCSRVVQAEVWEEEDWLFKRHWFEVVRNVLHAQLALKLTVGPPQSYLHCSLAARTPDDIEVALLRLKYVQMRPHLESYVVSANACLSRKSSRVFLEGTKRGDDIKTPNLERIATAAPLLQSKYLSTAVIEAAIYGLRLNHVKYHLDSELWQRLPAAQALLQQYSYMRTQSWTFQLGVKYSIEECFHLARCYRTCRQNGERARRMYQDLKHIPDNYDVSLNFPYGYMKINGRYVVKVSIVGSIYRWNYRIRRRKTLPFSAADIAYAKAVGLPVPEGSQVVTVDEWSYV